jgi:hypothetical protein
MQYNFDLQNKFEPTAKLFGLKGGQDAGTSKDEDPVMLEVNAERRMYSGVKSKSGVVTSENP